MSDGTADLQLPVGRPAAINELRGRTGLILPRGQDGVRFWEEAIDTDQGSGACRSVDAPPHAGPSACAPGARTPAIPAASSPLLRNLAHTRSAGRCAKEYRPFQGKGTAAQTERRERELQAEDTRS